MKRSIVSVGHYEIGSQEVEIRLYKEQLSNQWSAVLRHEWKVLGVETATSDQDAIEKAKALAHVRFS